MEKLNNDTGISVYILYKPIFYSVFIKNILVFSFISLYDEPVVNLGGCTITILTHGLEYKLCCYVQ